MIPATEQDDPEVILGEVVGVFGVRGWVKVRSYARPPEALFDYSPWLVGSGEQRRVCRVEACRPDQRGYTVQLAGISTRDEAESLLRAPIAVPLSALPAAPAGSWYWRDLLGLEVHNLQGVRLGQVSNLIETGAADVLVVEGERERLIPFVPEVYIRTVDLAARRMTVDWHPDD